MWRKLIITILVTFLMSVTAVSQSTEFSYQGSLKDGANAANGNYDFEFRLFDSLAAGNQIGTLVARTNVPVANGTFGVQLDFGGSFPGGDRYLEVRVRTAGGGAYTPLNPRQRINSAPYGIKSLVADTANNSAALGGIGPSGFIQNRTTQQANASFNISGNGTFGGTIFGNVINATVLNMSQHLSFNGARILSNHGSNNLFAGIGAGANNTAGFENTYFGHVTGENTNSGSGNSFFGFATGIQNFGGSNNSFFGSRVGVVNANGNFNSFFGHRAGENNIGSLNSFFGTGAGLINNSGNSNTFVGHDTGNFNLSGSFNTALGENADVGASDLTNATAIGSKASVTQSNSLILGSINGTNGATADTKVGIGTTAPAFKLHVVDPSNTGLRVQTGVSGGTVASFGGFGAFEIDAPGAPGGRMLVTEDGRLTLGNTGGTPTDRLEIYGFIRTLLGPAGSTSLCYNLNSQISTCSSSLRYKKDIKQFTSGLDLISRLRPVSFAWRDSEMPDLGLVAEDVAEVEPLLTTKNSNGQIEGVKYDRVGVVLINAVREQQAQIEELSKMLAGEKARNEELRELVEELTKLVCVSNRQAQICKEK